MDGLARVLVIDDVAATRQRLCTLLGEMPGVRPVGSCAQVSDVAENLTALNPHIVVIDVPGYDRGRLAVVSSICKKNGDALVIVVSSLMDDELRRASKAVGADHCLSKSKDLEQLFRIVGLTVDRTKDEGHGQRAVVLLVEDDPKDAQIVRTMLCRAERYELIHVREVGDVAPALRRHPADLILVDLGLGATDGLDTLKSVHGLAEHTPVVVLTGCDDRSLGLKCIQAGAQDYLSKNQLDEHSLQRAVGFAIGRIREQELQDLRRTRQFLRAMSSAEQSTLVTAAMTQTGVLSARHSGSFGELVVDYLAVLLVQLSGRDARDAAVRDEKERIATMVGDLGGGPRDLIDVHVEAIDRALAEGARVRSKFVIEEGRLLIVEMMGLLVDYYRIGRRRIREGDGHYALQAEAIYHGSNAAVSASHR